MIFSPTQLRQHLPSQNSHGQAASVWWVALSGGLDSTVLLHALCALQLPVTLKAVHVNHQISPNADDWQAQCAALCRCLGVEFHSHKVEVKNAGKGIEDAAREARYEVFLACLSPGDLLLTGHHSDDQSETLLLRLMRGTGPRGLAAMAQARSLGAAILWRPLLKFSRSELEAYAQSEQLSWVEDESNLSQAYDRNYLRSQVMPLLQQRWPEFQQRWQQTAEICAANESLLEELAAQDLVLAECRAEKIGTSLNAIYVASLSPARRQNLLRYWLRKTGFTTPELLHWQQLNAQFFSAGRADANPDVSWGNVSMRLFRQRLYALPLAKLASVDANLVHPWPLAASALIELGAAGTLEALTAISTDKSFLRADVSQLEVRYRQGGERCRPAGRAHSQTLKKLLLEYEVEPWLRERLPLVFYRDQLVAVADFWVCADFVAEEGQEGMKLNWML